MLENPTGGRVESSEGVDGFCVCGRRLMPLVAEDATTDVKSGNNESDEAGDS